MEEKPLAEVLVTACPAELQGRALELLGSDHPDAMRDQWVALVQDEFRSGRMDPQGLLVACRGGALAAATYLSRDPGRTATIWPPVAAPPDDAVADALLRGAVREAQAYNVQVLQALLQPGDARRRGWFRRQGFLHVTDLLYLVAGEEACPQQPPETELTFEPYTPQNARRLARMVEATCQETRDCPELGSVRADDDVLAGYRSAGEVQPGDWLLVRQGRRDIGCLLVARQPEERQMQLVYFGVVPAARGRGLGGQIVQHALWLARQSGAQQVVLAVDVRNVPAMRVYDTLGFRAWDRKSLLLRIL